MIPVGVGTDSAVAMMQLPLKVCAEPDCLVTRENGGTLGLQE
jgi:hypothetical protein